MIIGAPPKLVCIDDGCGRLDYSRQPRLWSCWRPTDISDGPPQCVREKPLITLTPYRSSCGPDSFRCSLISHSDWQCYQSYPSSVMWSSGVGDTVSARLLLCDKQMIPFTYTAELIKNSLNKCIVIISRYLLFCTAHVTVRMHVCLKGPVGGVMDWATFAPTGHTNPTD